MTLDEPYSHAGPALTVAVVSPDDALRDRLALLLAGAADVDLVDVTASDGHLAHLGVVLVDTLVLDDGAALELDHLLAANPCVVGLTRHDRPDLAAVAVALGAADVVPAEVDRTELLDVLRAARQGRLREVASAVRRAVEDRRSVRARRGD